MRMLEKLRILPLLKGYRGKPGVNMDALVKTIMRLSYLASDNPEISELDINPLLAGPGEVTALDARALVDPGAVPDKPYGHLALRPYPEEFVEKAVLKDGTPVLLRPVRPEDEPMWLELLGSCSRESIYSRFRFFYNWANHDAAVRHCYIDYDREMAIVAEHGNDKNRKLLGVGRLVADPGLESAEYAVLVGDPWQNRGLGGILTDFCERIAKIWGAKRIEAQTTSSNSRMVSLFVNRRWSQEPGEEGLVEVWKEIEKP
jgi:acetyltransferase